MLLIMVTFIVGVLTLSIGYTANKKNRKKHKVGNRVFLTSTVTAEQNLIIGQNKIYGFDHPAIQYRLLLLKSQWELCILQDCKMIPLICLLCISPNEVIPLL